MEDGTCSVRCLLTEDNRTVAFFFFGWIQRNTFVLHTCSVWLLQVFCYQSEFSMYDFDFFWFMCKSTSLIFSLSSMNIIWSPSTRLVNMTMSPSIRRWLMYSSPINIPFVDQSRFRNTHSRKAIKSFGLLVSPCRNLYLV